MAAGGCLSTAQISVVISSRPKQPAGGPATPAERVQRDAPVVSDETETRPLDDEPPPPPA